MAACSKTNSAPHLFVVGLAVLLAGGVCARADVPLLPATFQEPAVYDGDDGQETPQPAPRIEPPPQAPRQPCQTLSCTGLVGGLSLGGGVTMLPDQPAATQEVKQLPAGPGSLSLFLAALATFGGLKVGQSLKNVHLGALPEWYHDGGPARIGHSAPADLQAIPAAKCPFETPVTRPPRLLHRIRRDDYPLRRPQFSPSPSAIRGPPVAV